MKRTTFRLAAFTLTVATLLGACTLISEVDRSKIAEVENPPNGMGGEDGTGGTGENAGGDGGVGGAD
jgi:hypothetical protein